VTRTAGPLETGDVVALGVTFATGVVVATGAGACGDWGVPLAGATGVAGVAAGADVAGEPADDAAAAADADGGADDADDADGTALGVHADTPSIKIKPTAAAARPGAITESRLWYMMSLNPHGG